MTTLILLAGVTIMGTQPIPYNLAHGGTSTPAAISFVNSESSPVLRGTFLVEQRKMWVTAYTSSPEETDDTPFLTAIGTPTRDGIVATNMFPIGTRVQIPALFGDKTFVVEDRMHPRKVNYIDVWVSEKKAAFRIGLTHTDVLVLR